MTAFKIFTPVRGYTGESAGVTFAAGEAALEVVDDKSRSALSYFHGAGYKIVPLDENGPSVADAVRGGADPIAEARALRAEIDGLEARKSLDELRRRRDQLRREVGDEPEAQASVEGASAGDEPQVHVDASSAAAAAEETEAGDLLAPPAENASADVWRSWVVASGRASADEVSSMSRTAIIAQYGADYDRDRAAQLAADTEGADA